MNIKLRELTLKDFKGIRELQLDLNDKVVEIHGANGSGKTTVFDAITWLLFGKDSLGRELGAKVRTLGADGKPLHHLEHSVKGVFRIDDKTVTLTRTLTEKWKRERGLIDGMLVGTAEAFEIDGVPTTSGKYRAYIESLIDPVVFRCITDPHYFSSLPAEAQRKLLLSLVADITLEEAAQGNQSLQAVLTRMDGKSIEDYSRELAAKMKAVKSEVEGHGARVDELNHSQVDTTGIDFDTIEKEVKALEGRLTDVIGRIAATLQKSAATAIRTDIEATKLRIREIEQTHMEALTKEQHEAAAERRAIHTEMNDLDRANERNQRDLASAKTIRDREQAICEQLREEWKTVKARDFKPQSEACEHCDLVQFYNQTKARELARITENGQSHAAIVAEQEKEIERCSEAIAEYAEKRLALAAQLDKVADPTPIEQRLAADNDFHECTKHIEDLTTRLAAAQSGDTTMLETEKATIETKIEKARVLLARREVARIAKERIATLEAEWKAKTAELCTLEGEAILVGDLSMARNRLLEERINAKFPTVRFSFSSTQMNGVEKEACEATLAGVPYSQLNNAAQILVGLEIIEVLSREYYHATAPIIIDNAESISNIPETTAQQIRLHVDPEYQQLTILSHHE